MAKDKYMHCIKNNNNLSPAKMPCSYENINHKNYICSPILKNLYMLQKVSYKLHLFIINDKKKNTH